MRARVRSSRRLQLFDVFLGSIADRRERPDEGSFERGEQILDRQWTRSKRLAMHKAVAFESPQRLHEDFMRDAFDAAAELAEPVRALGWRHTSFYDLFRVENGKIAEHWDVIGPIPPKEQWKNQTGKFGF